MKVKEKKDFPTGDIWIASFLLAEGFNLKKTTKQDHNLIFVFQDNGKISDKVSAFINDQIAVSPKSFISAYRDLKSLIYSNRK